VLPNAAANFSTSKDNISQWYQPHFLIAPLIGDKKKRNKFKTIFQVLKLKKKKKKNLKKKKK